MLCIEVISGQQLRAEEENDAGDSVDPFVEISLRGSPIDERENPKTFKSKVFPNNGFNPIFDLQTEFKIFCPESVFIIFKVFYQKLAMDQKIGWNAVPFNCMRPGYRMVPLLNSKLNLIKFSCLLCNVVIKDV